MAEAATSEEQKTGYNRDQLVTELFDKLTNPKYHKEFAEAGLGSSLWTNLTKPEELKKALEDLDETDSEWAKKWQAGKEPLWDDKVDVGAMAKAVTDAAKQSL